MEEHQEVDAPAESQGPRLVFDLETATRDSQPSPSESSTPTDVPTPVALEPPQSPRGEQAAARERGEEVLLTKEAAGTEDGGDAKEPDAMQCPTALLRVLNITPLVFFLLGKVSLAAMLVSATALLLGSAINVSVQVFLIMEDSYVRDARVTDSNFTLGVVFCGCLALYAWGYLIWVVLSLQLERLAFLWRLLDADTGTKRADTKRRPVWQTMVRFVIPFLALLVVMAVWAALEASAEDGLNAVASTWLLGLSIFVAAMVTVLPDLHLRSTWARKLPPAKVWWLLLVLGFLVLPAVLAGLIFAGDGFQDDWRTVALTSYVIVSLCLATVANTGILLYELVAVPLKKLWERSVQDMRQWLRVVAGFVVLCPIIGGLLLLAAVSRFMQDAEGSIHEVDRLIIAGELFLIPAPFCSLVYLLRYFVVDDIEVAERSESNAPVSIVYYIISFFVLFLPALAVANSAAHVACIVFAFIFLGIWTTCMARPDDDLHNCVKASWWTCPKRPDKACFARAYGFSVLIIVPLGIVVLPVIFLPALCRVHLGTLFFVCIMLNGFAVFGFDRYSDYRMEGGIGHPTRDAAEQKPLMDADKDEAAAEATAEDTSGERKGDDAIDEAAGPAASIVQGCLTATAPWIEHAKSVRGERRQRGIMSLLVVSFLHAAVFGLAMLSQTEELIDGANPRDLTPVHVEDRTAPLEGPGYAICPQRYFGLDAVDLAYLVSVSYFYDPGSGDLCRDVADMQTSCFDRYFHANYTTGLGVPFDFEVLAVEIPESRSPQSAALYAAVSPAAKVVVVAVRGSVTVRDFLEDFNLYSEIATLQVFSFVLPFIYVWPVEATAFFVKFMAFAERLSFVGRQTDSLPVSNYYAHVEDYIRTTIRGNAAYDDHDILVVGHSLGAATAIIVGARNRVQSFAFEPPGVLFSHEKFGIDDASVIYETAAAVVRHNDPVTFADRVVGNVQTINCEESFLGAYCHLMRPIMCHLMYSCGALDRPAFDYWSGGAAFCSD